MPLYNLMISSGLKEQLLDFSEQFNLKMSEVVRMAIIEFIENHKDDIIDEEGKFVEGSVDNA